MYIITRNRVLQCKLFRLLLHISPKRSLSVCRLSHLCSLLKPFHGLRCHLAGTHSLSLIPGRGAGHRPNPFQVAPEASRVGSEGVSWPGVPPGVIMGRTLEHLMLDRLVGAVAVWADGRVPARDPVKVSCYQWGMTGDRCRYTCGVQ